MSAAKKYNKPKIAVDVVKTEPSSNLHLNLKRHPMEIHEVGKKVAFTGEGVVRSIHKDDYGHTCRMEVTKFNKSGGK